MSKGTRLLYVGDIDEESTSFARYTGLILHCNYSRVIKLNQGKSIIYKILRRLKFFGINEIRGKIINEVKNRTYNILWMDKPWYVDTAFILCLKKIDPNLTIIGYNTDDLKNSRHGWFEHINSISFFDKYITTNEKNFIELNLSNVELSSLGYDENKYFYQSYSAEKRENIAVFIGHYEAEYEIILKDLAEQLVQVDYKIEVYGQGWWKRKNKFSNNPGLTIKSGWISFDKIKKLINASKFGIGLYSSLNRNSTSGRIFEYSAMGLPIASVENDILNDILHHKYIKIKKNSLGKFRIDLQDITKENLNAIANETFRLIVPTYSWQNLIADFLMKDRNENPSH